MTTVQRAICAVKCYINTAHAAHAKHNLRRATHVHWSVKKQPRICTQVVLVRAQQFAQMIVARLFFAIEKEFQIDRW